MILRCQHGLLKGMRLWSLEEKNALELALTELYKELVTAKHIPQRSLRDPARYVTTSFLVHLSIVGQQQLQP